MSTALDLEIDTDWIRRAAATLLAGAQAFRTQSGPPATLQPTALGGSDAAAAAVALVNLRTAQAHDATGQLQAISLALAERLATAAQQFERVEASVAARPR